MTAWRKRLQFYWSDMRPGGGMPVTYTAIDGRELRTLWTGLWGVKVGRFLIGVVRGEPDPGHDSGRRPPDLSTSAPPEVAP